jgi:hypothetical protein
MTRTIEILAAAGLAPRLLELERMRGERQAAAAQGVSGAINALGPLIGDTLSKGGTVLQQQADDDANRRAGEVVAQSVGNAGDRIAGPTNLGGALEYLTAPGEVARRAVDESAALKGPQKTGKWWDDFVADPFGMRARAFERARSAALQGVTSEIQSARTAAQTREDRAQELGIKQEFATAANKSKGEQAAPKVEVSPQDKAWWKMVETGDPEKIRLVPRWWLESQNMAGILDALPKPAGRGGPSAKGLIEAERLRALKLENEKREREASQPPPTIPEGFQPTTPMVTALQQDRQKALQAKAAADAIRALMKKYPDLESYVGPLDSVGGWLAKKTGLQSTEAANIRSTLGRLFDQYRVAVTGAGAGVKEMAALEENVPNATDTLDAIMGKLQTSDEILNYSLPMIDSILETGDLRGAFPSTTGGVPGLAQPPNSSGASGSWGAPPQQPPRRPLPADLPKLK